MLRELIDPEKRSLQEELVAVSHAWDRAMVTNDPEAIGDFMHQDWTITGTDGNVIDKSTFLDLVRTREVTHNVMESHDLGVRVYGDAAVVTGRGVSGGHYRGEPFYLIEHVSSVFIRQHGRWRCVLTHLSPFIEASRPVPQRDSAQ